MHSIRYTTAEVLIYSLNLTLRPAATLASAQTVSEARVLLRRIVTHPVTAFHDQRPLIGGQVRMARAILSPVVVPVALESVKRQIR